MRRPPTCRCRMEFPRLSRPFPATVRAQQLALALADARGLEADAPAGLTKVTPTK
jgi:fructoselysine-6-P-deglycase FrlB-like protein